VQAPDAFRAVNLTDIKFVWHTDIGNSCLDPWNFGTNSTCCSNTFKTKITDQTFICQITGTIEACF
jgi:hypothetical protein